VLTTQKTSLALFPLSHLPLIGRETDLHTLQALYQNVQQGQMQVALIQGEAGIGKQQNWLIMPWRED
jgi:hypothetical protein